MEILKHFPATVRLQVKTKLRQADYLALQFSQEFERTLREMYPERRMYLTITPENALRLLNLRAMILHFRIPLIEVLEILFARYGTRSKAGLPAPILSLTGEAAWEHVRQKVSSRYPQGENQAAWKSKHQTAEVQTDPGNFASILAYQKAIRRGRQQKEHSRSRSLRRRYRNNPWT